VDKIEYRSLDGTVHYIDLPEVATDKPATAYDFLNAAQKEMRDRSATYDAPKGERSMGKTVVAFNALTGHNLTEQQGWQFMELLKIARSNQGKYRADCFVDGAAYAALAGEAAARDSL
jgi:hypothetical protein